MITCSTVSTDIATCAVSLNLLEGSVSHSAWAFLRVVRNQIAACAEQVRALEDAAELPVGDNTATQPED